MSRSRKIRVETLKSRAEYLKKQLDVGVATNARSYIMAELLAIKWAVPILEAHIEANRVLHEQLQEERRDRDAE